MSGINMGRVLTGGLLAGLVFNILDFLVSGVILRAEMTANMTRLAIDASTAESAGVLATWVVIDFLYGILVVWTYAAIRPRLSPGPKTAVYAGLIPYLGAALVIFGFAQMGLFTMPLFWKSALLSLIITIVASIAGAWVYKEG